MKYFGTDGIRGTYGDTEISEPFFAALGVAAAEYLAENGGGKIVVGGDTRASTDALKAAFCGGLEKGGAEFEDLGVLPTPALAYGVLSRGAAMGAMITASHNPHTDNGIKFFDSAARKVEDDAQERLEALLEKHYRPDASYAPKNGVDFPEEFSERAESRNRHGERRDEQNFVESLCRIRRGGLRGGLRADGA